MTYNKKVLLFPYLLILYEIAIYLSNDMYLPSMPAIARELFLSQEQVQNTLTFWFLGASSLQFILGPVSDRYGRKLVILIGGVFFVIASAVCALTSDLYILIAARFVQGTAICSALVAGYAAIHELFDTKTAVKLLAVMGAVTILAPAFGPLFGAIITEFASWRYIFWLLFGLGLFSLLLLWAFMPETNNHKHILHVKTVFNNYKQIFCNANFILATTSYAFLVGIFFVWMFESPFVMIDIYQKSSLYYGWSQTFIFSCFFLGAYLTKRILHKHTLNYLISLALIITMAANIVFMLTTYFYDNMDLAIVAMMLISTGTSLLFGPLNRLAIESCKQPMGSRTAVFSTIVSAFGALTGWLLTLLNMSTLFQMALGVLVCSLLAMPLILFRMYARPT